VCSQFAIAIALSLQLLSALAELVGPEVVDNLGPGALATIEAGLARQAGGLPREGWNRLKHTYSMLYISPGPELAAAWAAYNDY
jgi:hypothetical protein